MSRNIISVSIAVGCSGSRAPDLPTQTSPEPDVLTDERVNYPSKLQAQACIPEKKPAGHSVQK